MAGDWIAIRVDLHAVPEVLRLARLTGRPVDEVVGLLVRFWAWAQAHTDDGYLGGVDLEDAASGSHVPSRFLGALVEVRWLVCDPGKGLQLPNFGRWMGRSAKARLQARERQRKQRQANDHHARDGPPSRSCHAPVTQMSRSARDKSVTREEERREYKPPASAGGSSEPFFGSEPPPDSVLVFSCVGKQATWELTKVWLEELERLFPALDVLAECRKARAWLEASPRRRKTAGGMPRFLLNWLNRAVDGFRGAYGHAPDDPARVRSGRYQYDPNACRMVCVEADVPSATARKIPANSGGQVAGD